MNILHISYKDTGGAGGAAIRIHESIYHNGVDVNSKILLVWKNKIDNRATYSYRDRVKGIGRLLMRVKEYITYYKAKLFGISRDNQKELLDYYYKSIYKIESDPLMEWADIIVLHWVNSTINFDTFFKAINKPIVWIFHDMTPFSGGNPYERGRIEELIPIFNKFISRKREVIDRYQIVGISTNQEFIEKASNKYQTFHRDNLYKIAYPIDTSRYYYSHRDSAKEALNLDKQQKYLLVVAEDIDNPRKGFILLEELFDTLFTMNWNIIVVGRYSNSYMEDKGLIKFGYVSDQKLLRYIYSASDIFVTPSLEESYGQTTTEALLCGTPVVAFSTAGAKEQIVDRVNGYIAKEFTSKSLLSAIELVEEIDFDRRDISQRVSLTYNYKEQSKKYIDIFKRVLEDR